MGEQELIQLFTDYYYLDNVILSHTHSIEDRIIDKDSTFLARMKDSGVMIYSLYSSDQIWIPIEYINIFLGFMREEGDRLGTFKPSGNVSNFIVSLCFLVKSLFYGLTLGKEAISGIIEYRSEGFRKLMLEKFEQDLPGIILENIKDRVIC